MKTSFVIATFLLEVGRPAATPALSSLPLECERLLRCLTEITKLPIVDNVFGAVGLESASTDNICHDIVLLFGGEAGINDICGAVDAMTHTGSTMTPEYGQLQAATCSSGTPKDPDYPSGGSYDVLVVDNPLVNIYLFGGGEERSDANAYSKIVIALLAARAVQAATAICDYDAVVIATGGACLVAKIAAEVAIVAFEKTVESLDIHDGLIDAAEIQAAYLNTNTILSQNCVIDTVVDDNQLILDFLASPFSGDVGTERMIAFSGAGCDNTDNDSDSTILDTFGIDRTPQLIVKRIDECDEDLVPPTIVLIKDPPATFPSQEEGEKWFMENTVVFDDCAPLARLNKSTIPSTTGQVTIKVADTRCENMIIETAEVDGISRVVDGPGEPSATKTFTFVIDGKPPVITCGFYKPQDVNYVSNFGSFSTGDQTDPLFIDSGNEKGKLVDVKFFYQVEELPSNPGEKISIHIEVTSNEFEDYQYDNGRKMLTIIERNNLDGPPAPVDRATLLLAPFTCGDKKAGDTCLIEKDSAARFYEINLLATDTSGNVGEATCTVAVVPQYHYPKSRKNRKSTTNRNLSSSKGIGKGSAPPRPSRNALIAELVRSKQRYVLHEAVVVWDTGLDEGVVTPTPTTAPTSGKSGGKSSTSTKDNIFKKRRNKRKYI